MSRFVMLTQLDHGSLDSPRNLETLEQEVMARIGSACPEVKWTSSYAVLGPYDYIDVFEAPDHEAATKISAIVRTFDHAHTEIWPATEWGRYKDMIHSFSPAES